MSWNYRVIRRVERQHTSQEPVYMIATVFYAPNGDIKTFSADPVWPVGEDVTGLRGDIVRMLDAFTKPVLDERQDGILEELDAVAEVKTQ